MRIFWSALAMVTVLAFGAPSAEAQYGSYGQSHPGFYHNPRPHHGYPHHHWRPPHWHYGHGGYNHWYRPRYVYSYVVPQPYYYGGW